MRCRPLLDRILVERAQPEPASAGGVIIPESAKESPRRGIVVAVGPGARDESGGRVPVDLRVGQHVVFSQFAGVEIEAAGRQLFVIKESDVIGIIEGQIAEPPAAQQPTGNPT